MRTSSDCAFSILFKPSKI
jgi:hypothetical protein